MVVGRIIITPGNKPIVRFKSVDIYCTYTRINYIPIPVDIYLHCFVC